jgi:hypothetical protein
MCSAKLQSCAGCKHNWYSAPGGQKSLMYPGCDPILALPHSRCLYFDAYIPMVVETVRGCDGTRTQKWVSSRIPAGCPTHAQERLL